MTAPLVKGDTLLIESGTRHHLFVVLNDMCKQKQHALVSFSSIKSDKSDDLTCVFDPVEIGHPFIKTRSFVFYRSPMVRSAQHLADCIARGTFLPRDKISIEIVDEIFYGAFDSKFTPNYFKTYLDEISRT